jgi:hypothetical protein
VGYRGQSSKLFCTGQQVVHLYGQFTKQSTRQSYTRKHLQMVQIDGFLTRSYIICWSTTTMTRQQCKLCWPFIYTRSKGRNLWFLY